MFVGLLVNAIAIILLLSLTTLVALRRPPEPLWPSFFLVVLALALWAIGETCAQFLSWTPATHWMWVRVLYTGAIALPPAWMLFALAFAHHVGAPLRWDTPAVRRIPIYLGLFYWICLMTNPWHGQFITARLVEANEYHALWFAHIITSYAIFLGATGIFIYLYIKVKAMVLRRQIRLMLLGSSVPLLANFLYLSRALPSALDPTVAAMAVSAILFFAAVYRSGSFALTPFSVQNLLEFDDDPCLILNPWGHVVAYSEPATTLFNKEELYPNCDGIALLARTLLFPGNPGGASPEKIRATLFEQSGSINVEQKNARRNEATLRLTSTVVRSPGGKLRGVGVRLRDISVEARLSESQRLEALGVLAGGIAHDFNNLLTVVNGHAELLVARGQADERDDKSARTIQEAARQASELTDQMLAYAGRGRIRSEPLAIGQLVNETVGVAKHGFSKNTTVTVELLDEPVVLGDSSQLRQVFMNLVQNGAESIRSGRGQVRVKVSHVVFGEPSAANFVGGESLTPDRYAVIDVIDDGAGIRPEDLPRIFDPFYTTKFTGRGLGLAAVLGIIRRHQGALRVTSNSGSGSTFSVFLPWPQSLPRIEEKPDSQPPVRESLSERRVLVADDEPLVLELIKVTLEELGYAVRIASGGREAIATFETFQSSIDLVLLDLTMPDLGGEQVLARIKEIDPDQPVIVMSGFAEAAVTKKVAGLGAARVLRKPFESRQLTEAIEAV